MLIGHAARRARGLRRFSEPLTDRLLRALPGIDVRIVADRSKREWAQRMIRLAVRPASPSAPRVALLARAPADAATTAARRRRAHPVPVRRQRSCRSRALDAALRLARVEDATLVPAYLAPVPMALPLDAPLPRACGPAFELQEAIEQRAAAGGRAGRRAHRPRPHGPPRAAPAARRASATTASSSRPRRPTPTGFSAADVAWLLEHAPGEVAVLRPADEAALAAA